jgi:hypothetical protein
MSPIPPSRRPAPDAYDHLWPLLPVFAVFFAMIVFAAAADVRPIEVGHVVEFMPLPAWAPEVLDSSVPSADDALARLPDAASKSVPTF